MSTSIPPSDTDRRKSQFPLARVSRQADAAFARLVLDRPAARRSRGPGPVGRLSRLYMPLMREDECIGVLGLVGNRPNSLRARGSRPGRIVPRSGDDRHRERAPVQRDAGGAGAPKGVGRRARRDQQVGGGHGAGFRTILEACQRLFGTDEVCIFLVGEDGMVRQAASRGQMFATARTTCRRSRRAATGQVIRERSVYHIPDALADPDAIAGAPRTDASKRQFVDRLRADALGGSRAGLGRDHAQAASAPSASGSSRF